MSRYPHVLKIPASQLPLPGEWTDFELRHYYLVIQNCLPQSVPGVDADELATVTDITPETQPVPAEPEVHWQDRTPIPVDVRGGTKTHAADVHPSGKRYRRPLCKKDLRVVRRLERTPLASVDCFGCRRHLYQRGILIPGLDRDAS